MTSMKKLLLELSIASLMLTGGIAYSATEADIPVDPDPTKEVPRIRANNVSDGDFNSADVWTQHDGNGGWENGEITMSVVPWELPNTLEAWEGRQVRLKMDVSTLTTSAAIGSADNLVNMTLTGLWDSTINVKHDFYITGNFWQDGNSVINISDGATVSVSQFGNTLVNVDNATYILRNGGGNNGGKLYATNGAKIYQEAGDLNINSDMSLTDSTFYGKLIFQGTESGTNVSFTNSTQQASNDGWLVGGNGGNWNATYSNSVLNRFYNNWKSDGSTGGWNGDVVFLHVGKDAQQVLTFENGTVVNGAGAADGTSYWAMDAETRTLNDITNSGNINLGWWELNANSSLTVNLLSGSKLVSGNLEFANANANTTAYGEIVWNQSGSEDAITEAVFAGDVNLRLSRAEAGDDANFRTAINLEGYTSFISRANLNIGGDSAQSGTSTFSMSGSNNWAEFNSIYVRPGKKPDSSDENPSPEEFTSVSTNVSIDISGSNNTLYARDNLNLSDSSIKEGAVINFSMTGEGNVLNVNNFNVNNQDESLGGTVTAVFRGDNAANKNQIIIRSGEMIMQGSQALDATTNYTFSMQGNTTFNRGDGRGVWLKINEWGGKTYTSNVTFEVKGSGNDILLSGLEVGKDTDNWDESLGKGTLRIVGGENKIVIKSTDDGHNGFKLNSGGVIEFVVDNTGITPITNLTFNNNQSNGMMKIDFSNITTPQEETRYVLFQTSDHNTNVFGELFDVSNPEDVYAHEDFVSVILANDDDMYRFALEYNESEEFQDAEGNNINFMQLVIYYTNSTVVPEPATYAAIFGALALAFAAYRRRK